MITPEQTAEIAEATAHKHIEHIAPTLENVDPHTAMAMLLGYQMTIWSLYRAYGVPQQTVAAIALANINEVYSS